MKHRCLPAEDLARLLELPADDPRRLDAGTCPRCDAMLCVLRAFLAGDPEIPSGERVAADRALARFIDQEFVTSGPPASTRVVRVRAVRPGWLLGGLTPARKAALATVCALAAVMLYVSRDARDPGRIGERLRGRPDALRGAGSGLVFERSQILPGGDLELVWTAVEGADRYVVELFDGVLDTVAVYGSVPTPALRVAADVLARTRTDGRVLVRVRALCGEALVACSPLQALASRQ